MKRDNIPRSLQDFLDDFSQRIGRLERGGVSLVGGVAELASTAIEFTNKTINLSTNVLAGTIEQFNEALIDGEFATRAGAETLTNKTINLADNTVQGTLGQFNQAITDGNVIGSSGWSASSSGSAIGTSETLIRTVTINAVAGATYRAMGMFSIQSDTAAAFTWIRLRHSTSGPTDATGTQFQLMAKDHRMAGRQEGVTIMANFTPATSGTLHVKMTADPEGGAGTVTASASQPSVLYVDRLA